MFMKWTVGIQLKGKYRFNVWMHVILNYKFIASSHGAGPEEGHNAAALDSVQMGAGERREGWQRRLAPSSVRMGTGEKSSTAREEEQCDAGEKSSTM
jgi:hypothetical protein